MNTEFPKDQSIVIESGGYTNLFDRSFMQKLSAASKRLLYGPRLRKSTPGRVLVANGTLRLNNMKSRLRAQRRRGIVTARQQRKHIKAIRREAGIANYAP